MADEKFTKRRRRSAVVYTPIAVLLIIIILIFGISVFFRISNIEVKGAKKYTVESIISESGIEPGDNLIFVDAEAAEENIALNLPYLNEVIIEKIVPDTIIINVMESQPIAVVRYNGDWWIVDQKARVLEKTSDADAAGKIKISGIDPESMVEGRPILVNEEQQTKLMYLTDILSAISKAGLSNKVGSLEISNIANISFTYTDRFTVILGSGENADYKLSLMNDVMTQLAPDEKGKIDLSREGEPHFVPY